MGDFDLITLYLSGDSRAFTRLAQRHLPQLLRTAHHFAHNEVDAWDITQEALLKASQCLATFRRESSLSTWLYRLVANAAYDFYRRQSARELPVLDEDTHSHTVAATLSYLHVDRHTGFLWIADAISQLPEDQRAAIFITDILGFSVDEAASQLGCAPGTVKSRRHRARAQLKDLLAQPAAA